MRHPSTRRCTVLIASLLALAGCAADRTADARPTASEASVAADVEQAKLVACSDLGALMALCQPAPPRRDPTRDRAVVDSDTVTLGDTTVKLHLTPGHTLGTVSPVFDVQTAGQTHRVLLWGGTAFNCGRDFARLDADIASTQRARTLAQQQGIDVLLSNHANYDGALAKLEQRRAQPAPQCNPFVIGNAAVVRALTVMGECAQPTRDRFALQPG